MSMKEKTKYLRFGGKVSGSKNPREQQPVPKSPSGCAFWVWGSGHPHVGQTLGKFRPDGGRHPLGGPSSSLKVERAYGVWSGGVSTTASTASKSHSNASSACGIGMGLPESSQASLIEGGHLGSTVSFLSVPREFRVCACVCVVSVYAGVDVTGR